MLCVLFVGVLVWWLVLVGFFVVFLGGSFLLGVCFLVVLDENC